MEVPISIALGLEAFLTRAANHLGVEIKFETQVVRPTSDEYLSIIAVSSMRTQIAIYPAVHIGDYRGRMAIRPANADFESLEGLQVLVNQSAKSDPFDGVATFQFSPDGKLINVIKLITLESIWSLDFAKTSVFENAVRSSHELPLGVTDLKAQDWLVMNFNAPENLDMKQPFLHLFAHEPGYRIHKATSHTGYVALDGGKDLFEKVSHAVDYLEGVINE